MFFSAVGIIMVSLLHLSGLRYPISDLRPKCEKLQMAITLRFGTCFDIWRVTNAAYLLTYLLTRHPIDFVFGSRLGFFSKYRLYSFA